MKNKLTYNLGLKLISLVAAIIIWLIIIYTYDPVDTADFTLEVTILNEDAITSLNKVYEVIEGQTVTIRVKGNTTQVNSLKASDFRATADISKLSPTYHASIDVVCTKTNNVEISFLGKVKMLAIRLEDVAEKQFKVTVVPEGTPAEGYYAGVSTTKPNLIQVSGAESAVERISQVCVAVDVADATETFTAETIPRAYDADGKEIKTGSLTFSKSPVMVTTTIYGTKEVPVEIVAEDTPYSGYRLVNIEYEPKTVIIAGDDKTLEEVSSVHIPISVANRITSLEETLLLEEYLPDNVYLTDPTASVNVQMEIVRLATKLYEVPYEMIQLRDADQETWNYALENGVFAVKVMGLQEDLDGLEIVSLRPYAEVGDLSEEGTYTINVQFELDERFELSDRSGVTALLTLRPVPPKKEENEGDTSEEGSLGGEENQPEDTDPEEGTDEPEDGDLPEIDTDQIGGATSDAKETEEEAGALPETNESEDVGSGEETDPRET